MLYCSEVRTRIEESGNIRATSFDRLPPVISHSLGLLIKYGGNVTILEAQTQMVVHQRLQGNVSMPEIFSWIEDNGQRLVYMYLVEGATLQKDEQESHNQFVGHAGKQPLNEAAAYSAAEARSHTMEQDACKGGTLQQATTRAMRKRVDKLQLSELLKDVGITGICLGSILIRFVQCPFHSKQIMNSPPLQDSHW
ncbi:hypothetical protein LY76DRAFT_639000 [Colletotrichum caudatum]|nr:hypothetical protein LY76DRAFT_639000 [Colletotrichum caudatum]